MALPTQQYKGARDFYPEDKRLQKYLFGVMRSVAERFGYEEYDAPIIEPLDLYLAKTGDEIVNEQTYAFEDRGGRKVALRPEMTPSVSRMVAAKRQELVYPLRWYSIPVNWRYERPQRGRNREFWQLNIDLFGVENLSAELEMIQIVDAIVKAYGATHDMYVIKLNSRKLLNFILAEHFALTSVQVQLMSKLIDHMHKMDHAEFVADADSIFTPSQRALGAGDRLFELLRAKSLADLPPEIREHESVGELQRLIRWLADRNILNVEFDITLMRGLDYYTGVIFEVFDTAEDNIRSMFGGGRYDGLVGLFGVEPLPTVGFAMGDVPLQLFLESHNLLPSLKAETEVYVILIGDVYEPAQKVIADLREMGLNVAVDTTGRKPDKQIKTAVKKGLHYVIFIGDQELNDEQYTIKNILTGEEEHHSLQRIVSMIKDYRADV
jgi:histidyl-tRNA synthetase